MFRLEQWLAVVAGSLALLSGASAYALTTVMNFEGVLVSDDDVAIIDVSLAQDGRYSFESFGFAGGVRSDGSVVASGGFDTVLSLYDDAGDLIRFDDDNTDRFDSSVGAAYDARIVIDLSAGNYQLAVTQFDNFPLSQKLVDGFERQGEPNFTSLDLDGACPADMFCDVDGNVRTAAYAGEVAVVPLPASLGLLLSALGGGALVFRRRKASS